MSKKRMPARRKATGNPGSMVAFSAGRPWITGRIPDSVPGPERVLTWAGESLKAMRSEPPEPKGKLGTMTGTASPPRYGTAARVARGGSAAPKANGPEGDPGNETRLPDGTTSTGGATRGNVRRLRQRIFKATQEQDWAKVRSLQKLMLRSRSNTLVSVRQVTQRNAGRRTAGVDGEVALTSAARAQVAVRVHRTPLSWALCRSGGCIYRRSQWATAARSGFRRRRHSAALSSDPSGFVIVTHPFHPLNGQRLEVLYVKRRGADTVFVCSGGVSGQITLPQAWTDRGEPPVGRRLSAEGLAGLDTLARSLRGR